MGCEETGIDMKESDLLQQPPIPCEFSVGQHVIFTNDYGVEFRARVIGFAEDDSFRGRFIHLDTSSWWFPVKPESLRADEVLTLPLNLFF